MLPFDLAFCFSSTLRTLAVFFDLEMDPPELFIRLDQVLSCLAVAIGLLPQLETFEFESDDEHIVLDGALQLAILAHPTLRNLSYDRWYSPLTPYNLTFNRTRSHPITIKHVAYPDFVLHKGHILPPSLFFDTFTSFISRYRCPVQSLELSSLDQRDGLPLPRFLESPIEGLTSLTLNFSIHSPPPDLLIHTDWISLFLKRHPLVRKLRFDAVVVDEEDEEEDGLGLPWLAFSFVDGLDGLSDQSLVPWRDFEIINALEIEFSEDQEKKVVGLEFARTRSDVDAPSLESTTIEGLATAFPDLRKLQIYGKFDTPDVSSYLTFFLLSFVPERAVDRRVLLSLFCFLL